MAVPALKSVLELVRLSADYLNQHGITSARLEAELLLAHVLECDRLKLYMDAQRPVVVAEVDRYRELIRARGKRIPLQHLMGEAHILEYRFQLQPGVFIPRPETEILILRARDLPFPPEGPARIVEVGTGSGCIGISLLLHWPQAQLQAWEIDPRAHETTLANARLHGVAERLQLHAGSVFDAAPVSCDLLVSNPPYVPTADIQSLEPEVRDHDPHRALDGGADGLDFIRRLAPWAKSSVQPGGWLILEHGFDQYPAIDRILQEEGWSERTVFEDLSGHPRVMAARRP